MCVQLSAREKEDNEEYEAGDSQGYESKGQMRGSIQGMTVLSTE